MRCNKTVIRQLERGLEQELPSQADSQLDYWLLLTLAERVYKVFFWWLVLGALRLALSASGRRDRK